MLKTTKTLSDIVCFGEMLWDIFPDQSVPGGAPMNVAYHLKKHGVNSAVLSRVGKDDKGKKLLELLRSMQIDISMVQDDLVNNTGIVNVWQKSISNIEYEIVDLAAWDFIEWRDGYINIVYEAKYMVYGSLSSRNERTRSTLYNLLELPCIKVLDINLRPPHFNQSGIEYLLTSADILKLNLEELETISQWGSNFSLFEDKVRSIRDRFSISTIIVTQGADGAIILNDNDFLKSKGYNVKVVDTIGSGDAFLAGFLWKMINHATIENALQYATKLGAFVATKFGACPEYQLKEVDYILNNQTLISNQFNN